MQCPEAVASLILQIVRNGILTARSAAWSGDAERCAIETTHIHNLSDLLLDYHPELLDFYWNIERPQFLEELNGASASGFESLWQQLKPLVPHAQEQDAPRLAA